MPYEKGAKLTEEIVPDLEDLPKIVERCLDAEGEFYFCFTLESDGGKTVINDALSVRGLNTIKEFAKYVSPSRTLCLIICEVSKKITQEFLYHPLLQIAEYPTLLSFNGCRKLSGSQVLDQTLLSIFFERGYEEFLEDPTRHRSSVFWENVFDPENAMKVLRRTVSQGMIIPDRTGLHDGLCYWDVREAAAKKEQAALELKDIGLSTAQETEVLEEMIRNEFLRKSEEKSDAEALPADEQLSTEEVVIFMPQPIPAKPPIIPINLESLYIKKEVQEIERKPIPVPPKTVPAKKPPKKKNPKGKGKKGKGGGKQKGGSKKKGKK